MTNKNKDKSATGSNMPEDDLDLKEVGARLKFVRDTLGLTLTALSDKVDVAYGYISDFERGRRYPSTKFMMSMVRNFNVNFNYIFAGDGTAFISPVDESDLLDGFGIYKTEIIQMLLYMCTNKNLMFHIFSLYNDYLIENKAKLIKPGENVNDIVKAQRGVKDE